jgi:hypothetical protein
LGRHDEGKLPGITDEKIASLQYGGQRCFPWGYAVNFGESAVCLFSVTAVCLQVGAMAADDRG